MNNLAIVQARMGSSRLPGKVLFKLKDWTVLEHVVRRIQKSNWTTNIIIGTTIDKNDGAIVSFCKDKNFPVFCGSPEDVLDRFYQIALLFNPDNIVRVTADCPLIDPQIIDDVIDKHLHWNADYTNNNYSGTYPHGEDVEVFTFAALENAWQNAKEKHEREHVTPFIKNKPDALKLCSVECPDDYSDQRWTLDYEEDFVFLENIFDKLFASNNFFTLNDIITLLNANPQIRKINAHLAKQRGYQTSSIKDKLDKIIRIKGKIASPSDVD